MNNNKNPFAKHTDGTGGQHLPFDSQADIGVTEAERAKHQREGLGFDLDEDTVDELPAGPHRKLSDADLELLQFAARALGAVQVDEVDGEDWLILHFADGTTMHGWNPLLFSNDALELAVKLHLGVIPANGSAFTTIIQPDGRSVKYKLVGDDELEGVRDAIVLAAAEMGKAI